MANQLIPITVNLPSQHLSLLREIKHEREISVAVLIRIAVHDSLIANGKLPALKNK